MTMITPSYLGETIEYSSLHACRSTLEDPTHISLRGGLALLYLIVCGSLLAFTAFIWLLSHLPATRISSYAYVNPVIAVALGYFVAGEVITPHALLGTALVLTSVFMILRKDKVKAEDDPK